MMNQSRNWKWMLPAGLVPVLFVMQVWLNDWAVRANEPLLLWCGCVTVPVMFIFSLQAVAGFRAYYGWSEAQRFSEKKNAQVRTQLSAELEASRGVHPEVVKLLINERHRVWMLKSGIKQPHAVPHSVLFGAPQVTDFFLMYFLQNSSEQVVMAKRKLVEGRKNRFDPWGAVTEYEMYDRLIELLVKQGKITRFSEYENYSWVSPWSPALVAEDFALELEEDEVEVEKS